MKIVMESGNQMAIKKKMNKTMMKILMMRTIKHKMR